MRRGEATDYKLVTKDHGHAGWGAPVSQQAMCMFGKIGTCAMVGEIVTANNGDVCWSNPRQLLRSRGTLLRRRGTRTREQSLHDLVEVINVDITVLSIVIAPQLDGYRMTSPIAERDEAISRE
jgi:hypothetical protein